MKKYLVKFIAFFGIAVTFLPTAMALTTPQSYGYNEKIYMCDDADLLTLNEDATLEELSESYFDDFDLNISFPTTNDAENKSIMAYSDGDMDGLFQTDVDNNIALAIDMDNREIYVNAMDIADRRIYDGKIEYALDYGYDRITNGDYYNTMSVMASYCLDNIVNDKTTIHQNYEDSSSGIVTYMIWPGTLIGGIGAGIIVIVLLGIHNSSNRETTATKYMSNNSYQVIDKNEILINTYDTVQKDYYKPKSDSNR
jgi:uncharacterized protein